MMRPDGKIIDYALMPLPDGATLMTFADVTEQGATSARWKSATTRSSPPTA